MSPETVVRPTLLTSAEVAKEFGVARRTVWRWVKVGCLNPIRTPGGRVLRFSVDEVRALQAYQRRRK